MPALGWLLNLDFAGGTAAAPVDITQGLEYTVPENRTHYTIPENRCEYTTPEED